MDLKNIAKRYAVENALKFGKAMEKPIIGKILGSYPEFRKNVDEVKRVVNEIVKEINSLDEEEIKRLAKDLGISMEKKKEKKEKKLPEIDVDGIPVFRIAPNPNGPLHMGHARMVILNDEYSKKYGGKLILRFDDTDPKNPSKRPVKEAYEMIREDLKWLDVKWDKEIIASQRLEIYYKYFEDLLKKGQAYICTCDAEEWRKKVREKREACPCRSKTPEENLKDWEKMLNREFKEGEAVGRVKTSLTEKDPAVIDWVAFRIVDNPIHPLYTNPPHVWPSLDFASAIDDYEMGVTHIIRGKDLYISEKRQKYVYEYFGWRYPKVYTFGKIFSEELIFSTSKMRDLIEKGVYSGFDDIRLPTIRAFRKRGIHPQAIRNYIISLGLNDSETVLDMEILFAENRKVLDPIAERYFAVLEPEKIELEEIPYNIVKAPLFPRTEKFREIPVENPLYVEKGDFEKYHKKEVRLMHFCNVVLDKKSKVTSMENKDIPKIHWVSKPIKIKIVFEDKIVDALGEKNLEKLEKDTYIQFERIGFARYDGNKVFYFANK